MKKYLRLYSAFFKASLIADLEYRANFLTRIATDIFWYLAQIVTFETIYRHTNLIGGWTVEQMRVFLGVLFVVDAFYMILFHDNLDRMSERVRKGELDLLLAKPVNSQFMLSCQRLGTAMIGNLLIGTSWLVWSLSQLPDFQVLNLFWLLVLIPSGLLVVYSCRFIFSSTAVIFTRSENLMYLWFQLYKLGMRPDSIYVPWLRILLLTILPMAFIVSIPARSLLFVPDYALFAWAIFWSLGLLYVSHLFWKFALKFYSSASS
ncbi:MAG: ABC-2 family transporter protein [Proteobacteria bacterium]|jgi:ABC-2 type transport system permease protein|nr:ABC-2 family transporter protein [Pseudomonadota bacterium]